MRVNGIRLVRCAFFVRRKSFDSSSLKRNHNWLFPQFEKFKPMKNPSNDDEETDSTSGSLDRKKTRTSQRDLVKRIYYPETLYPDNYSFFTDRTDPNSNLRENPPIHILNMDSNEEYRNSSTTDPGAIGSPPNQLSAPTKLETNEIEIIDRTGKYSVSQRTTNESPFAFSICFCVRKDFDSTAFRKSISSKEKIRHFTSSFSKWIEEKSYRKTEQFLSLVFSFVSRREKKIDDWSSSCRAKGTMVRCIWLMISISRIENQLSFLILRFDERK